ncbi:MAG: hypothetical protein KAT83_02150 [Candidatus Aenigmarchaeota archaeon]|nr:hypothetical protein [Candidatus Aenigmarchaeota archaeon]
MVVIQKERVRANNMLENRKKILNKLVGNIPLNDKITKLFEIVRDIPYGDIGSRDPWDVYEKNRGTCSGKHELLKELYKELGIQVKDFIAMHKFNDLKIDFPSDIKEVLNRTKIIDPHNFFKILIDDKWICVDITWDKPLKKLGFVVNENWDGKTDMELCVIPIEILETEDPIGLKKKKICELPEQVQLDRKLFLKKMTEWFDSVR